VILLTSLITGALTIGNSVQAEGKGLVGIAMPTTSTARWKDDGNNMVKYLKEAGYTPDLENAEDDIPKQISQIDSMISNGAKVLVIGAIDGSTLSDVLQKAADKGVKVISYDRMITKTKNVDYYATFNNFEVGVLQANALIEALKLKDGKGPFNIELFGGSPDDTNAYFFYDGAMSVLKPYIDSGKLVVRSRQKGMEKVATLRWDGALAQSRMDNLLTAYYRRAKIQAVLSPNDGLAIGILNALKSAGYCTAELPCPYVTGQDAEIPSVKSIIGGEQYSTVFKDTRELAKVTVSMVDAIMSGKEPVINDTKTYNNGVKVLPSHLLKPVVVNKGNYKKVLVDSGYIKEDLLK
jgi:putative multiple sugar transport system substrate-binding protein